MFQPGELLVYGTTGVCRVEGVATPNLTRAEWGRQYYLLKPLYQDGVIYAPGGEDIFLDLFEVFPEFLRLNINGKSGAKNVFLYNPDSRCRIDQLT